MFVGVGRITLRIPGARSLKDRRRVVSSYKDRVKARLCVSVAEVGPLEDHQRATLGVALVARDAAEAEELLSRALQAAEQLSGALVLDSDRQVLPWRDQGLAAQWLDRDDPFEKG